MSRSWNRRRLRWLVTFAFLAVGVSLAVTGMKAPGAKGVRSSKVVREALIQRITIAGHAEPVKSTIIAAPYDGYVKKLYVQMGSQVKAGDPLVSLAQSLHAAEVVFPIRAPFSGTVVQLLKSEGQFAKQGDTKDFLLRLDDLSTMYVYANAPEIDVVKIKTGLEADIKVSAILSQNYKGIVREISQAATTRDSWGGKSQVDYRVKIEVTNADHQLKPGMSAVVDVITAKKDHALVLPHEFIQKEGDGYFVTMKDGQKRAIQVGLHNESAFEVTEGLKEGEEVQQIDFAQLIDKK